jgi:hypothetical protein
MSKQKTTLTNPNEEVLACSARFKALHGLLKQTVMGTKLLKYFLGLEASRLYELHAELYGETRGGDQTGKQNGTRSVLLETFLEDSLGVTARSARKYRDFFQNITTGTEHEDTVKRLNGFWIGQRETMLSLPSSTGKKGSGGSAALSLQTLGTIAEKDLQTILEQPDEWGLHELFEVPLKDVSPAEDDDTPEPPDNKGKLIKFWLGDFARRLTRKEYMRLPKAQRETLATDLELALHELKDSLAAGTKKKGKA